VQRAAARHGPLRAFGLGRTWNDEYGTAADPEELGWLLGYSPYHRVVDGTPTPAVLFTVFDGDSRVDPLHARKLCAALQAATTSDAPVLLRAEADVGHGAGRCAARSGSGSTCWPSSPSTPACRSEERSRRAVADSGR
jgi:prolyl oligopeptidase PreP (S9A serine peptidase family)